MKQHEYDTNVEQSEMNGTGLVATALQAIKEHSIYWARQRYRQADRRSVAQV